MVLQNLNPDYRIVDKSVISCCGSACQSLYRLTFRRSREKGFTVTFGASKSWRPTLATCISPDYRMLVHVQFFEGRRSGSRP